MGSEIQSAIMYIVEKVILLRTAHPAVSGKIFSVFQALKSKHILIQQLCAKYIFMCGQNPFFFVLQIANQIFVFSLV